MWAACINELSPLAHELRPEVPKFLKKAFNDAGVLNDDEIFIPVRPVAILGTCSTAAYADCPNIPEHHIENSQSYNDPAYYLNKVGQYYWFDFDIMYPNQESLQLRMVFNVGDGDCNDGMWGAVWDRNTEDLMANILSTGDSEATVQAISKKYIEMYEPQSIFFPSNFDEIDDPIPCSTMEYANEAMLEKIIGIAIRLCCVYRNNGSYKTYGYTV
ncbi:hypothetical protein [Calothrix sp. NIES-2098]|uniref:hypothetical protein n=1 Tax=Calothrix sp. NIES-2098 TaxID=1954171 RepID=UPI000B5ECB0D|nr:hypothetical protein NIES2098_63840 [Calothrix sp. NIES-2098]